MLCGRRRSFSVSTTRAQLPHCSSPNAVNAAPSSTPSSLAPSTSLALARHPRQDELNHTQLEFRTVRHPPREGLSPRFERVLRTLSPVIVLYPQAGDSLIYERMQRIKGTEVKLARARPAIALHDRIHADPGTLCVYSDASVKRWGVGIAATAPSLNYTVHEHLLPLAIRRPSVMAEFFGVVLALELAAMRANPNQAIALFTDCMFDRNFNLKEARNETMQAYFVRAEDALARLKSRHCDLVVRWIPGHRGVIQGIIAAHNAAGRASFPMSRLYSQVQPATCTSAGLLFDRVGVIPESRTVVSQETFLDGHDLLRWNGYD